MYICICMHVYAGARAVFLDDVKPCHSRKSEDNGYVCPLLYIYIYTYTYMDIYMCIYMCVCIRGRDGYFSG